MDSWSSSIIRARLTRTPKQTPRWTVNAAWCNVGELYIDTRYVQYGDHLVERRSPSEVFKGASLPRTSPPLYTLAHTQRDRNIRAWFMYNNRNASKPICFVDIVVGCDFFVLLCSELISFLFLLPNCIVHYCWWWIKLIITQNNLSSFALTSVMLCISSPGKSQGRKRAVFFSSSGTDWLERWSVELTLNIF